MAQTPLNAALPIYPFNAFPGRYFLCVERQGRSTVCYVFLSFSLSADTFQYIIIILDLTSLATHFFHSEAIPLAVDLLPQRHQFPISPTSLATGYSPQDTVRYSEQSHANHRHELELVPVSQTAVLAYISRYLRSEH